LSNFKEYIHFGLTSQDINNTAIPLSLMEFLRSEFIPELDKLSKILTTMANNWIELPMLAHTHGQAASPTRLGKELMVFQYRISQQKKLLLQVPHSAKCGGATGQLNAHVIAFPNIDWIKVMDNFVSSLGLEREIWTTQISNYDNLGALCDAVSRINVILLDLCKDIWHYISIEYFKQTVVSTETGSSVMPHKVNPIDFENAEGNLGQANAMFHHFSSKLPISRLQRDLTDSTVLRSLGVPFSHTMIALASLEKGLGKLILNEEAITKDLEKNYEVVSEGIQTVLRRVGIDNAYDLLKEKTRTGSHITRESLNKFIDDLKVSDEIKNELKLITPFSYIGVVPNIGFQ